MKKLIQFAIAFALILSVSKCATIVRGTSQDFTANSDPGGARIVVDGQDSGKTPTTLTLKRDRNHTIVFKLDGYEDVTVNLNRKLKVGSAIIGNVFSWGLIGVVVDISNGSAYQLTPEQLDVTLRQIGASTSYNIDKDHIKVFFFTPDQVKDAISDDLRSY